MASFTGKHINMDGSSDPHYRYKMPAIAVKHEGRGKMKKSVLTNVREVSASIGRPIDYLVTYLGQKLGSSAKVERDSGLSYVTGHHNIEEVQKHILNFVQDAVMCPMCQNPETSCHIQGSKKHKLLFLICKGCGERSDLDPSERFVKHMISHHAQDAVYGHAGQAVTTASDNISSVASTANMENEDKKMKQQACPKCNHKTSKSTRSRCGSSIKAVDPLAEVADPSPNYILVHQADAHVDHTGKKYCPSCGHKTSKTLCSKCGSRIEAGCNMTQEPTASVDSNEELVVSVKRWMAVTKASDGDEIPIDDFMAQANGVTGSTSLDCVGVIVDVITDNVASHFGNPETKLQPITVAQNAKPFVAAWLGVIDHMSSNVGATPDLVDLVISKVQKSVALSLSPEAMTNHGECVVVGLLLALRDVGAIAGGILEGCRRLEKKVAAMVKFVDFLADEDTDNSDCEGEDEEQQED
jgi:translation initiation factor 2 beta subunit (eIF-2beta)/eIF-5